MSEQFPPDPSAIQAAHDAYDAARGTDEEARAEVRLRKAFASPRTRLLQRFAAFPEGVRFLVRWGTHGRPMQGVTIRIVDAETGLEKAVGEVGEITVQSPGNFKGYWNKPKATAKTLRDGWVWTGDQGRMDADGYLTFIGRTKEMIKVSGYSVFPEEVETILIKHPAVAQAAVLGEPDAEKGEVVKAFVVRKPGAEVSAEELIAWSRENMATYKAPRYVAFIDALPATGSGKVLRRLLKDVA